MVYGNELRYTHLLFSKICTVLLPVSLACCLLFILLNTAVGGFEFSYLVLSHSEKYNLQAKSTELLLIPLPICKVPRGAPVPDTRILCEFFSIHVSCEV